MNSRAARRVIDSLTRALLMASAAMLIAIVAINGANVVGRYIFSSPISWGEEVMLYLMIIAVFLSCPAVTWDGAHIRMDFLAQALPSGVRRGLEALADLISLGVAALIVYVSVPFVLQFAQFDQRSNAAGIPMALPHAAIPLGFALAVLVLVARELSGKAAEHAAARPE